MIAEGLLQSSKLWFASAVPRGNPPELEPVMQYRGDPLNLGIKLLDLVQSAEKNVYVRINRGRLLQDVLHARMRTADDQDQPLRAIDGQRQLLQLQRSGSRGDAGKDKYARRHFGPLTDGDEVATRPWCAGLQDIRRMAAVVAHVGRE